MAHGAVITAGLLTWINAAVSVWDFIIIFVVIAGWVATRFHLADRLLYWLKSLLSSPDVTEDIRRETREELNNKFDGHAKLWYVRTDSMPSIVHTTPQAGELCWLESQEIKSLAQKIRTNLADNASHGLVVDEQYRLNSLNPVRIVATDFATIIAARKIGEKPSILSAGAIVFCPADQSVLLLHRSTNVATFPNFLHVLGGNYEPQQGIHSFDDIDGDPLKRTAVREMAEEAGLHDLDPKKAFVLVAEEPTTGFIAFVYAGIAISSYRRKEVRGSGEGAVQFVPLNKLVTLFETGRFDGEVTNFVPMGALVLLSWLKLGAPDQHRHHPMRKKALWAYSRMSPHVDRMIASAAATTVTSLPELGKAEGQSPYR